MGATHFDPAGLRAFCALVLFDPSVKPGDTNASANLLLGFARARLPKALTSAVKTVLAYRGVEDALSSWGPAWQGAWPPPDQRLAPFNDQPGAQNLAHRSDAVKGAVALYSRAQFDLDPAARAVLAVGWQAELRRAVLIVKNGGPAGVEALAFQVEASLGAAFLERVRGYVGWLRVEKPREITSPERLLHPKLCDPSTALALNHQEEMRRELGVLCGALARVAPAGVLLPLFRKKRTIDAEMIRAEHALNPTLGCELRALEQIVCAALAAGYARAWEPGRDGAGNETGEWFAQAYTGADVMLRGGIHAMRFRIAADLRREGRGKVATNLAPTSAGKNPSKSGEERRRLRKLVFQRLQVIYDLELCSNLPKAHFLNLVRNDLQGENISGKLFDNVWADLSEVDGYHHIVRQGRKRANPCTP
jgi:hypothetical protein